MNQSNVEHIIVAIIIQIAIALIACYWSIPGHWWIGAGLAAGIFIGREHNQAENRVLATGRTRDKDCVEGLAFLPRYWNKDSVFDLACVPVVFAIAWAAS